MTNRTFAIIKPDAVKKKYTEKIYNHILESSFNILAAKLIKMSKSQAENFYLMHKHKPFYNELVEFMTSGNCMILVLEKENAVDAWRETIGTTNPQDAKKGTIRKLYASSLSKNAVHGSDSNENAKKEIAFFFNDSELI